MGMMQLGKKCLNTYLNDDVPVCRLTLSCLILLIYRSPRILLWIKTNHRDKIDQRAQIDAWKRHNRVKKEQKKKQKFFSESV